ncbi:fatty acid--CoA ligase [Sphingobium sp. HBC34]|uniref:Fatty acid--CoA ligase n=1 Tax=Sphingobium cyanobacteriorum TaxID=3063954 RepID=A0ABT8ZPS9_9SPHN|nr:fatty acid--CoA ligase [Sphingobium sp. HBC34]MDO7836448.1 fatty acid--CoA ligase [Sphingobium sp. HBC34]
MTNSLCALLGSHAATRGDAIALEFGDRLTSFAQLDAQSFAAARALAGVGVLPGQRIGYLGKNSDRYFELLFAASKAGAVMVPIGWRLTAPEIAFLIDDSEISVIFFEPAFLDMVERLAADRTLKCISTEGPIGGVQGYEQWRDGSDMNGGALPPVDVEAPIIQLYTSGTTGRPKGAMLTHCNIFPLRPLCAAENIAWDQWHGDDVSLLTMPVAHIAGTGWGLVAFYNGARSIIMPEFDAGQILDLISSEQISRIFLVPTAIQAVLRHADVVKSDFSRLKYILYGASPIPLGLLREAIDVFGCGFVQNYGMTETCGTVVSLGPEDHDANGGERLAAAGRALPGVELKIVDERLAPVAAGVIGEIMIKSPTTMIGYWKRPEATADALIGGWMRTGDAGYLDQDGYLFVQDRLKDMIISGGENVYPAEVESTLYSHPDVAEVAVIGIPDDRWGEAVTAIVVPANGAVDERELLQWARERLAAYKVPKKVIVRQELPRNPSGKIMRRLLREPFWAGMDRAVN